MKRRFSNNFFFYLGIVTVIVALGFFRDFLFVNLNYQVGKLYYQEFYNSYEYNYHLPSSLSMFGSLSYMQLYWVKWVLSAAFAALYFFITLFTLRRMFPAIQWITRVTLWLHAAVFLIAVLFYLYGFIPGRSAQGYSLALDFMHLLQSPFILMILIPAFKLVEMGGKRS